MLKHIVYDDDIGHRLLRDVEEAPVDDLALACRPIRHRDSEWRRVRLVGDDREACVHGHLIEYSDTTPDVVHDSTESALLLVEPSEGDGVLRLGIGIVVSEGVISLCVRVVWRNSHV